MKKLWIVLSLVPIVGTMNLVATPTQSAPPILVSSENPALIVKNVRIDRRDGKVRGSVQLRFGYQSPLLAHVHVYGLSASGHVIAEGCDKLSGSLLSAHLPSGKGREDFSASLGNLSRFSTVQVVANAGHSDCKMSDTRIFKLF